MSKYPIIILLVVIVAAAGLYLAFGISVRGPDANQPAANNGDYAEYNDTTNHVSLLYPRDWNAVSTTGHINLMPKSGNGDVQTIGIELWAAEAKTSDPGFKVANAIEITPDRFVRVRQEQTEWKDADGNPAGFSTSKTFVHWAVSPEQNIIFEISPAAPSDLTPQIKKIIESVRFE
jgi:hypothetical protein